MQAEKLNLWRVVMGRYCGIDPLWIDKFIYQLQEERRPNMDRECHEKNACGSGQEQEKHGRNNNHGLNEKSNCERN
jgi:hypothetical protein